LNTLAGMSGSTILASAPAFADDAQLQQQINAMQRQLQAMQDQLAETKRQAKAAAQQAQQTQAAQQQQAQQLNNIPPNLYAADVPIPTKGPPSWFDSIHVSMAGTFIAMEGAIRQRNEVSSGASDPAFSTIPLQNSPLYGQNETRFSAQQSRLALKASGDIDPTRHVKGYFESDFLGAGVTANSRESNSYNLRIRQAYLGYDDDNWHSHFSAGQMWSLLTPKPGRHPEQHRKRSAHHRRAVRRGLQLGPSAGDPVRAGRGQGCLVRRGGRIVTDGVRFER
jgi:hypothetical protein